MTEPDRIFSRLDAATVYMDGSSPLVARTREFRGSTAYVREDGNTFDALRDAFLRGASWRKRNGFSEGEAEEYLEKAATDYADIASAKSIPAAPSVLEAGAALIRALEQYGFPVSDAATTGLMERGSLEAKELHAAALNFRASIALVDEAQSKAAGK